MDAEKVTMAAESSNDSLQDFVLGMTVLVEQRVLCVKTQAEMLRREDQCYNCATGGRSSGNYHCRRQSRQVDKGFFQRSLTLCD